MSTISRVSNTELFKIHEDPRESMLQREYSDGHWLWRAAWTRTRIRTCPGVTNPIAEVLTRPQTSPAMFRRFSQKLLAISSTFLLPSENRQPNCQDKYTQVLATTIAMTTGHRIKLEFITHPEHESGTYIQTVFLDAKQYQYVFNLSRSQLR